jgi:hypothetical protein
MIPVRLGRGYVAAARLFGARETGPWVSPTAKLCRRCAAEAGGVGGAAVFLAPEDVIGGFSDSLRPRSDIFSRRR